MLHEHTAEASARAGKEAELTRRAFLDGALAALFAARSAKARKLREEYMRGRVRRHQFARWRR